MIPSSNLTVNKVDNYDDAGRSIFMCEPFRMRGNNKIDARLVHNSKNLDTSNMSDSDFAQIKKDLVENFGDNGILVVVSHRTPIAWYRFDICQWFVVDKNYSNDVNLHISFVKDHIN